MDETFNLLKDAQCKSFFICAFMAQMKKIETKSLADRQRPKYPPYYRSIFLVKLLLNSDK